MAGPQELEELFQLDPAKSPIFHSFPAPDRDSMLHDDLFAGRSVSTLLASIVIGGMLLMVVTVLIILY